jgi:hypothetical protein
MGWLAPAKSPDTVTEVASLANNLNVTLLSVEIAGETITGSLGAAGRGWAYRHAINTKLIRNSVVIFKTLVLRLLLKFFIVFEI